MDSRQRGAGQEDIGMRRATVVLILMLILIAIIVTGLALMATCIGGISVPR